MDKWNERMRYKMQLSLEESVTSSTNTSTMYERYVNVHCLSDSRSSVPTLSEGDDDVCGFRVANSCTMGIMSIIPAFMVIFGRAFDGERRTERESGAAAGGGVAVTTSPDNGGGGGGSRCTGGGGGGGGAFMTDVLGGAAGGSSVLFTCCERFPSFSMGRRTLLPRG